MYYLTSIKLSRKFNGNYDEQKKRKLIGKNTIDFTMPKIVGKCLLDWVAAWNFSFNLTNQRHRFDIQTCFLIRDINK